MRETADAFIALPGGLGTIDEIVDILNSNRVLAPIRPCALLNVDGYYAHLISFIEYSVEQGMVAADELGHPYFGVLTHSLVAEVVSLANAQVK